MSMDSYAWADAARVVLAGVIIMGTCALFIYVGVLLDRYERSRQFKYEFNPESEETEAERYDNVLSPR